MGAPALAPPVAGGRPHLELGFPEQIRRLLPAVRRGLAFGIPALDAALPQGVPRGQITALDAPLGSGGTTLLLALAEATLRFDEGVALVDAERSLAPQAAAHLASLGPFWVVRPKVNENAWWCADVLLRTGAFGLVIVDRVSAPARRIAVRLQRLAHDKDCALVVRVAQYQDVHARSDQFAPTRRRTGGGGMSAPAYGAAVILAVEPAARGSGFIPALQGWGGAWPAARALRVTTLKGGAPRAAEVAVGVPLPDRLRPHWAVRDRRAPQRADRRPERKTRK
jgi:recA bacterial DNA recombination protein